MRMEAIDFVQFNYALNDRAAERRLLPLAAERGIAVLVNRPFRQGALLRHLSRHSLPDFAAETGCESWAELALISSFSMSPFISQRLSNWSRRCAQVALPAPCN
jgi:aryl-alcohol dehydrogenase-like predicted oxidoreductase